MKLPDPVAQIAFHYARNESNKITVDLPIETRLYSEAQLREALASHEAVMRMALAEMNHMQTNPPYNDPEDVERGFNAGVRRCIRILNGLLSGTRPVATPICADDSTVKAIEDALK